jgi:hypothetical protein
VTAFVGVASVLDLPPVAQLMAWGDGFNGYWAERSPDVVPTSSAGSMATEPAGHGAGAGRYAVVDAGTVVPAGKQAAARLEAAPSDLPTVGPADDR